MAAEHIGDNFRVNSIPLSKVQVPVKEGERYSFELKRSALYALKVWRARITSLSRFAIDIATV